jgi:hypothetical protein
MSNSWGTEGGGSGSIEDSGEAAGGGGSGTLSRLIIKVPGYDGNSATSYLRLGAVPTGEEPGANLAELIDPNEAFIDDDRNRGGSQPAVDNSGGHGLAKTARKEESARLHTKGGWRDHSDGNRVTTTTGDKVEVIRGNYKLLVLGRQDDPEKAAAFDVSGGLIQSGDIAPGSITEIRWVQDVYSGTWHVLEEAEKGAQKTVYHGDIEETFYGNNLIATTGSEDPTQPIALQAGSRAASLKLNPTIVEKTWATKITSDTGSAKTPVPSITETTHALHVTSATHCLVSTEHTNAISVLSTTVAGTILETSTAGLQFEFSSAALKVEAYAGALTVEISGGLKIELELSGKFAMSGPLSVELTWGKNIGLHNFKDELEVAKTELTTAMGLQIASVANTIIATTDTKIGGVETKLNKTKTELTSTITTRISNVATALNSLKGELANAHILS